MKRATPPPAKRRGGGHAATGRALRLSPAAWRRTWTLIGWAFGLVAVVWGLQRVTQYVKTRQAQLPWRLEWVSLPQWLRAPAYEWVREEIEYAAGLQADDHVHAPDLCERVGRNLAASPWVATVQRVSKYVRPDPNTGRDEAVLQIEATFREPLALVEMSRRAYVVDSQGVLLPVEYGADYVNPADPNMPMLIVGVAQPAPEVGAIWPGEDLAAGLTLAKYLRAAAADGRLSFRSSLKAIDVGNYDLGENAFDGRLRLRTILPRCYIRWGEPPGQEYPIEVDADRKLEMLRTLYATQGQFPDGWILDVRKEDGIERQEFPGG